MCPSKESGCSCCSSKFRIISENKLSDLKRWPQVYGSTGMFLSVYLSSAPVEVYDCLLHPPSCFDLFHDYLPSASRYILV